MVAAQGARTPSSIDRQLHRLEEATGRTLGAENEPLLLEVSIDDASDGASIGWAHVGLDTHTVAGYARLIGDEAVAWKRYEQLVRVFATTVRGVAAADLAVPDPGASAPAVRRALTRNLEAIAARSGAPFPDEPRRQLSEIVAGVAAPPRPVAPISGRAGSPRPVLVQAMVHGDATGASGAGTAFSRNPATGEAVMVGDFLPRAVGPTSAGIDPLPVADLAGLAGGAHDDLERATRIAEEALGQSARVDFVVERGRLWVKDLRAAAASPYAALRLALEHWAAGALDLAGALGRIPPAAFIHAAHPRFVVAPEAAPLGRGIGLASGTATGALALGDRVSADRASVLVVVGDPPDGWIEAGGVITDREGHDGRLAALARSVGRPVVSRVPGLRLGDGCAWFGTVAVPEGQPLSIDGGAGVIYPGACARTAAVPDGELVAFLAACDHHRLVPLFSEGERAAWADDGYAALAGVVCRTPAEIDRALQGDSPIVVSPGGRDFGALLGVAGELAGYGVDLLLRIGPEWPPELTSLPPMPWLGIVATAESAWAGRALAAALPILPPSRKRPDRTRAVLD